MIKEIQEQITLTLYGGNFQIRRAVKVAEKT